MVTIPGHAAIGTTFSTFTIVARDASTGDLGVASCSRAAAVGAVVPWVRAGVGAAAAQAWADAGIGPRALDLLRGGLAPREALANLLEADSDAERRQVGLVSASGIASSHTGRQTLAYAGAIEQTDVVVLGNLLAGRETLEAMRASFQSTEGKGLPLAERLLRSLEAGQTAGGDRRGSLSAALLTAGTTGGPASVRAVNLRVDDHERPVEEIRRIYDALSGRLGYRRLSRPAGDDVLELQRLLKRAGFFDREPDGQFDDSTVAAVQAFRKAQGMYAGEQGSETGLVDADLILRLHAWLERPATGSMKKPGQ
jgi:uncharacterized Ntn-hydrolase superfamily protein